MQDGGGIPALSRIRFQLLPPTQPGLHCAFLCSLGPLRIDVTVTAKWPLWVLRNVTPFTPNHFRQSSEQIFLVLVFVFLKTVFLEFISNAL